MRTLLLIAPLALAACQVAEEAAPVDAAARSLADACLAEIGKGPLPADAPDGTVVALTEAERTAFETCLATRAADAA